MFRGTLIGATSWIHTNPAAPSAPCDSHYLPQVWARVTAVMDWIVMHTKGEKPPPKNSNCEDIYYEDYCVVLDDALIPYP